MPEDKLRVRRRGDAMIPNYEAAQSHGQAPRFHTHKHDLSIGPEFKWSKHVNTQLGGKVAKAGAFVGHDYIIEVPDTAEYRRHLRDGDLWPADQETAQAVGRPFDPTFGGEAQDDTAPALVSTVSVAATEEH